MAYGTDDSCAKCLHKMRLTKFDFSQGGCKHSDYEGWACVAFMGEGLVIHHYGIKDPEECLCEEFVEKEQTDAR